jgi:hypothetical protein
MWMALLQYPYPHGLLMLGDINAYNTVMDKYISRQGIKAVQACNLNDYGELFMQAIMPKQLMV